MAVYFARRVGTEGPIKIGFSGMIKDRLRHLAREVGTPVELLAVTDGSRLLEYRFHASFEADHVGREWFAWTPALQTVIEAVAEGRFDHQALPPRKRITHAPRGTHRSQAQAA